MTGTGKEKVAALEAIRRQLGNRVTSGTELLRVQESREVRAATGLGGLNEQLGGGLPKGQLTEILSGPRGGAGLVMAALLAKARRERRYVVLLDVGCGFTPESFPERDLEVLLWVGCSSAGEAVEALDIASRDENFSLFFVDLRGCESAEWRSVRANQWQRVLGQLRQREAVAVLFANDPVTSASKRRIRVEVDLTCDHLEREREILWEELQFSAVEQESAATGSRPGETTAGRGAGRGLCEQRVG